MIPELSTAKPADIDLVELEASAGYRLDYFQAYNWGTFHERIGHAAMDGQTTLLTGENGAGKSTLADGIVTLLVPTNKRNYNAASSEAKRERSEIDYIRGNTGRAYNEVSERDEPVYLRADGIYYTVLLGVFRNRNNKKIVSLAQILWIKSNGETAKIFIVEDKPLTIGGDLSGFLNVASIKENLRERGIESIDRFQTYSEKFHRQLRLNPDRNPMDIFNQTIAVKDIKNLTQFIRDYMLDSGSAEDLFLRLKDRVRELRTTHAMIVMQKEQLKVLDSIATHISDFRDANDAIQLLEEERDALEYFFAQAALTLRNAKSAEHAIRIQELVCKRNQLSGERESTQLYLEALRSKQRSSAQGGQIASLESELELLNKNLGLLQRNKEQFERHLEILYPNRRIDSEQSFTVFTEQLPESLTRLLEAVPNLENQERNQKLKVEQLKDEFEKNEVEISNLLKQHTSINAASLERRDWIAESLGIPKTNLPFVGELLRVRKDESRWTGAIESLLRNFSLTILVHSDNYKDVDEFVTANRMKGRIEYFPVLEQSNSYNPQTSKNTVAGKIEIKPESGNFGKYLQRDIGRRFDHVCCETTDQLWHNSSQALTVTGLFKGKTGRRIKDDRNDINDRSFWIMGWNNHDKLALLKARNKELLSVGGKAKSALQTAKSDLENHQNRIKATQSLLEAGYTYDHIDLATAENSISGKQVQIEILKKDPILARLSSDIAVAAADFKLKDKACIKAGSAVETADQEEVTNLEKIEKLLMLTQIRNPVVDAAVNRIAQKVQSLISDLDVIERQKTEEFKSYSSQIANKQVCKENNCNNALSKMGFVINHPQWGHLHDEVGSVAPSQLTESHISKFEAVRERIRDGDIPKNEEKFNKLLQENVISDFNTFRTSLEHMEQTIITRINSINIHLSKVDFDRRTGNETYIRLIPEKTRDQVVRDFRVQLHGALKDILNIDDDLDAKTAVFLQVNDIIESLDKDIKRRDRVIDVRNWFDFKAEERFRNPDRPKETYQGAVGKSGGEKSRLASTILATAIAYQYDIDIDRPEADTFRFVLIDEALSRIGDEFSAYLFEVFARFHLQLLIIHPRDAKLHITERFVRRYNVALKPGRFSSIANMTVHEFHQYKDKFA